jgi:hypothetical protein
MAHSRPSSGMYRATTIVLVACVLAIPAYGKPPKTPDGPAKVRSVQLPDQPFLREYGLGVQRIPMDGGKIYGWKLNDKVTFGRFKGENDEFGFSVELNSRQRVEITTDGLRWRRAIGGGSH